MRAARVHEVGAPPRLDEAAEPQPANGRSAARVRAVALNPLDLNVAAGRFYGGHPPLPYIPGSEAIVDRADGGKAWFFGDGAGVARDGTLAEYATVVDERLITLPEGTDEALAAALGIAGIAGWGAAQRARITSGDRVLVLGATGTAGSVALQAARVLGADRVVAAGRNRERLARTLELGAAATVQIDGGELAARFKETCGGEGPTAVLDFLWERTRRRCRRGRRAPRTARQRRPVGGAGGAAHLRRRPRQGARRARLLELLSDGRGAA